MGTRKVKDAKDLLSNELIYFRGHAKATYLSDGRTVEEFANQLKIIIKSDGDGTKYLSNDGTYKTLEYDVAYPIQNHTESTFTLTPNILHVWEIVDMLTLVLGEAIPNIVNEYCFQFSSGDVAPTLVLPASIKWINGFPNLESGKTYQCSIINNIGVIVGV